MEPTTRRNLLLALNARHDLSRDAICRLALAVDGWGAGTTPATPAWAAAIGVPKRALEVAIASVGEARDRASSLLGQARGLGIAVVVLGDPEYPLALHDLPEPPPVLYCSGALAERPAIAVVGSRAADPWGLEATRMFAGALARAGLTVVSGLAPGIDTAAHRAAIDVGGSTVAVLGCGLDVDYPKRSQRLRREIAGAGAVLSEFAPGTPALPAHFPIRNRIIAALGCGCVVIQAAERSGSLLTAHRALDLGRDVWALPGRIFDRRSAGANRLIRDGASPALSPDQILEALPLAVKEQLDEMAAAERGMLEADACAETLAGAGDSARGEPTPGPKLSRRLLEKLAVGESATAEELAQRSGQGVDRVLAALLDLEIEGLVGRVAGSRYIRRAALGRL